MPMIPATRATTLPIPRTPSTASSYKRNKLPTSPAPGAALFIVEVSCTKPWSEVSEALWPRVVFAVTTTTVVSTGIAEGVGGSVYMIVEDEDELVLALVLVLRSEEVEEVEEPEVE